MANAYKAENIIKILRPYKGHLQTVGLACKASELGELSELFYMAGVNRVTSCDGMLQTYIGEPHDGRPTLLQYTRE